MKSPTIEFVNHASVIISYEDVSILSDPWFSGTAFHDGWRLMYELQDNEITDILKKITHVYISHEHPDHFRPAFLENKNIKNILIDRKVEFLFQNTVDKRVVNFLKKNGYKVWELNENEKINLSDDVQVQIIKYDFYDSALIIKIPGIKILNLNDCPMREEKEINKFRKKHGNFDIVLSQYSYAAWKGGANNKIYRENAAKEKLESLERQATILNCKTLIPFANFVYFSNELNSYMNDSINTPEKVINKFLNKKFDTVILAPKEIQEMSNLKQNQASLDFWKDTINDISLKPKDRYGKSVSFENLKTECETYNRRILKKNSKFLIFFLHKIKIMHFFQTINIKLYDHNKSYNYSIFKGFLESENSDPDVSMHSQSLDFIFKNEFGFDTLTVNGCFESDKKSFSKFVKTFGIGTLNASGLNFNLGLLAEPQIIFSFFKRLKNVAKNLI
jgi:hypothetical protein